jgi:hypothetical protein
MNSGAAWSDRSQPVLLSSCIPFRRGKIVSEPTSEPHRKLNVEEKAFAKRLGSGNVKKRQKAEQEIREMGAAGRDLLIAIMRHEERQREDRRFVMYICLIGGLILFGVNLVVYFRYGVGRGPYMALGNLIGVMTTMIGFGIYTQVVPRAHINAAYLLAKHFEDVSIIGPLAEALAYRSKSVRAAAATALIRLLPRLKETDADLLTSAQRSHLHRALMGSKPELVLAILCAFEQVGDSQVMPNVQKLSSGVGAAGKEPRIRNAAQQTLLHLNRRIEA